MKIGIDISQLAYEHTGVANFLKQVVEHLIETDRKNEYILFYSSLRKKLPMSKLLSTYSENVTLYQFRFPPTLLDILWNKFHIVPIEKFIGDVDVFISSDWTQPPTKKAQTVTFLYDLIVYTHPEETAKKIITIQKRRLEWVKKECKKIICISKATKKDAEKILGIAPERLEVIYPGI